MSASGSVVAPQNLPDLPIKNYENFQEFEELLKNDQTVKTYMMSASGSVVAPPNLPDLPIKNYENFQEFEELLKNDQTVKTYMINRLAAVGGSGVEGLIRRMLKLVMDDALAMLFNWKGREKRCFESTIFMGVIYDVAKISFPHGERNDLIIANTVKDWLKNAKTRALRKKTRL